MKGKLRLEVTPIEGEWERSSQILNLCKDAIERWPGDDITSGYVVRTYSREEGGVYTGNKRTTPYLILEAVRERQSKRICPECGEEVRGIE